MALPRCVKVKFSFHKTPSLFNTMSDFLLESVLGFVETHKMNASLKLSDNVYPSIKPSFKTICQSLRTNSGVRNLWSSSAYPQWFNLLKVKSSIDSIDAESKDHYNKKLLECRKIITDLFAFIIWFISKSDFKGKATGFFIKIWNLKGVFIIYVRGREWGGGASNVCF